MNIRLASPDDVPSIVGLAAIMHAESTYAPMNFDPDMVARTLRELIAGQQFVALCCAMDGDAKGFMIGTVGVTWFGRDQVASDMALFIEPGSRGGLAAARLIAAFAQWAEWAGAKQIRPGVSTGNTVAVRLYERLGFAPCGSAMFKTVG